MNVRKYIPNILTTIRLLLVPVFMILFINKQYLPSKYLPSTIIFIIASTTDFIDGYLARLWHVESKYGKIIDPIADKSLMISASILCTIYINKLTIILMILEIIIAVTNYLYLKLGTKFYVSYIGKIKTATLMITISYILLNNIVYPNNIIENILIIITSILQIIVVLTYFINRKKNKK